MSRNILISVVVVLLIALGALGFIFYKKTSEPVISKQEIVESKSQFLQKESNSVIVPGISEVGDYGNGITYFDISGTLDDFKLIEERYVMTMTTEDSRTVKKTVDIDFGPENNPVTLKWTETIEGSAI